MAGVGAIKETNNSKEEGAESLKYYMVKNVTCLYYNEERCAKQQQQACRPQQHCTTAPSTATVTLVFIRMLPLPGIMVERKLHRQMTVKDLGSWDDNLKILEIIVEITEWRQPCHRCSFIAGCFELRVRCQLLSAGRSSRSEPGKALKRTGIWYLAGKNT